MDEQNIEVLGKTPYGFFLHNAGANGTGRRTAAEKNGAHGKDGAKGNTSAQSPLERRWAKGVRLFHDEWGYGSITSVAGGASEGGTDDEYVITVRFETGAEKRFMPKFQAHSLLIVKD